MAVGWRYLPSADSHRKNPEAQVHPHMRESLAQIPRFPMLTYESADKNSTTEYSVTERGVKENNILNKKPKNMTFRFVLTLTGLEAVLAEDKKTVPLYSTDDTESTAPVFVMMRITMQDAAGAYSKDAHYELTEESGTPIRGIDVNPAYLNSEDRLYPVTIDPQIEIPILYPNNISMTSVCSDGSTIKHSEVQLSAIIFCKKQPY